MTPSQSIREIAAWPRRRAPLGLAVTVVLILVVAALSGLPPFGTAAGAGWRYPLVALLATGVGLYAATAMHSPVGAEMTLCDLRWPALAVSGVVYAGRNAELPPGLVALFGVAAITLMLWAVSQRLEQERRTVEGGDGEVCVTCRPLFVRASSSGIGREGATLALVPRPEASPAPSPIPDRALHGGAGRVPMSSPMSEERGRS